MKKGRAEDEEANSVSDEQPKLSSEPKFLSRNILKNVNLHKIIINISDCQYPVVKSVSRSLKWKVQIDAQSVDWDVWWTDNAIAPETLFRMLPHQKINHFPGMHVLARKNLLGRGLMRMRKYFPEEYNFFPLTWMLPSEYSELRLYFESKPKGKSRTFIVKPEALSQGKGIYLTRRIEDIPLGEHCVVQRYLHKPYLLDGLKFDFRIYVLLASVDPMRVYLYKEGLARFATEPYVQPTAENMEDVCMHLTNYAINKDNPKFIFNKSEKDMSVGHKRSLTAVYDQLARHGVDVVELKQTIKDILIKTFMSGLPALRHQYRSCQIENYASNMCFQILGFDIMLDEKARPFLLEVNHTPSFVTDTPLDEAIKKSLIKDSLVLMNINIQAKQHSISAKREEQNRKILNIRKEKPTAEQKEMLRAEAQAQRDSYENLHLGGFEKIYPAEIAEAEYARFLEVSTRLFEESQGIRKRAETQKQKLKEQTQKPKSVTRRFTKPTPPAKPLTHVSNLRALNQDDSVLPYLKAIQRTSFEQQFLPIESLESCDNLMAAQQQVREEEADVLSGAKKLGLKGKEFPTNGELLQFFNNSFVEYRGTKEDILRKRDETLQNIDALQREQQHLAQQRFSPIKVKYGEEEPQPAGTQEMQPTAYRHLAATSLHRNNQAIEKKEPGVQRAVRYRSNLHTLIQSRTIKPISSPIPAAPNINM